MVVVYSGSFNKFVAPCLRYGIVVAAALCGGFESMSFRERISATGLLVVHVSGDTQFYSADEHSVCITVK